MRFISTAIHGIVDYVVGVLVIALPFYLGWLGPSRWAFPALGVVVILYSALTDYEFGVVRLLPVRVHLWLDVVFGAAMLVSPFLLGIPNEHHVLIYAIGAAAVLLAAVTKVRAQDSGQSANIKLL